MANFSEPNFSASMALSKQSICSSSESRNALRRESTVGQHVDGCFKHIQASVCADMMEAVSWVAALHIQAEGFSVAVGAALVGMARNARRIRADKHGVVILGILI